MAEHMPDQYRLLMNYREFLDALEISGTEESRKIVRDLVVTIANDGDDVALASLGRVVEQMWADELGEAAGSN